MAAITPTGAPFDPAAARPFEAIEVARTLLRTSQTAALATLDPTGFPFATTTNLVVEADGTPLFYAAGLTLHARNIERDNRVSLTMAEPSADAMTRPRLTLVGRAVLAPAEARRELEALYLARFPGGKLYLGLPDARFYRLAIEAVHVNGGPGRNANMVTPEDLRTDLP